MLKPRIEGRTLYIRQGNEECSYTMTPICVEKGTAVRLVPNHQKDTSYDVWIEDAGRFSCDCPAGTYRGICKHILVLRDLLK